MVEGGRARRRRRLARLGERGAGSDVTITVDGCAVTVDDAMVVPTDVEASNGNMHLNDAVLLPPSG